MQSLDVLLLAHSDYYFFLTLLPHSLRSLLALLAHIVVFAPTDDAFAKLGSDNIAALLNDTLLLTDVLLFHVVPEAIMADELPCPAGENLIEMANGDDLRSLCANDVPTFLKGAFNPRDDNMPMLVQTDIETCSGIIHVLDGVLLSSELPFPVDGPAEDDDEVVVEEPTASPVAAITTPPPTPAPVQTITEVPTDPMTLAPTTSPVAEATTAPVSEGECMTVSEIACSLEDFSMLCGLLEAQNLTDTLDDGVWTGKTPKRLLKVTVFWIC